MSKHSWIALFALAAMAVSVGSAGAQVLYGSLTGNVTDSSGAGVPNAKVEVVNLNTGIGKQAASDERGTFLIQDLQPGAYKVTMTAPSFATAVQPSIEIVGNTLRRLDVQLQVAAVGQSVTIEASAAVLQTDRADVNTQIPTTELADLPMTGSTGSRNFESLVATVPGFTPPVANSSTASNPQQSQAFYVNGSTMTGNNMKLDGASDIYPWLPQIASYIPPAEAIETVNIVTNSFDAEQGMAASSAINAIIKSGTNQFHGAAWEYNTNSALKARNFFYYGATNPKNILNQFGVDAGGPIVKNKLFFFADWERTIQRTLYSLFQTVATDALRQGNFNGTGTTIYDLTTGTASGTGRTPFPNGQIPAASISPAAAKMIALIPEPNLTGGISNDYFAAADWRFRRDNVDMKINYNPTGKVTLFGRYSISPSSVFDPQALGAAGGNAVDGGQPGNAPGRIQSVSIGGTYTISPSLLIDGNAAFTRLHLAAENVDINKNYGSDVLGIPGTNGPATLQGGYPSFAFTTFSSLGNPNASNPFLFRDNLYVETVNLSWTKGSHSIRFGGEFFHYMIADFQANTLYGVRGGFTFSGGASALSGGTAPNMYNSWADFLLGLPSAMGQDHQYINPAVMVENNYGFYARDQWQVNRKLTVTYGLRYEIYPYSHAEHGIDGIHYDPATNIVHLSGTNVDTGHGYLAPRLGVAYRVDEKTVIRAGYGINTNGESFRNNVQTYPEVISAQYTGANSYTPAGSLATGVPAFVGPNLSSGQVTLPPNFGSWIYPTPYRRGYAESYNFTMQRDLGRGYSLQAAYVGTRDVRPSGGVNINAAVPGTGKATQPLYVLYGNASTISEMLPIDASRYNALQVRADHRVGNANFGAAYTFSKALDAADNEEGGSLTWNWGPTVYRNYALAGYDRTHNFQLFGNYALPFGKGQRLWNHGAAAAIAGGWQINGILSRISGTPFTVGSSATSLNAPGSTQTANQVVPQVQILGGHGTGQPYFDPNAFLPVTTVSFGNSGRDILRGPGVFNVNASLFRTFAVSERFKLQFRAEALGLTNTAQFANPSATVSNATFSNGVVTNLNGYDTITSASGERQVRLGVKVRF
ncbi:MAG: TonB-dependent receptor [Bryobacteraceae bacterium]|jgi:hypothetical protein